ncbi:MAG: response regulator [Elusimicrobia bacterium]|nr:response regulator [Elusimicrobiota bacterium]
MNVHQDEVRDIVVVDDDADLRGVVCAVLRRSFPGLSVVQAKDGLEARKRMMDMKPRVVIVDLHMPGLDGRGLCEYIQSEPWLSKTRVLVLTGHCSRENREAMFQRGTSEFLGKPFEPSELVSSVARLLA